MAFNEATEHLKALWAVCGQIAGFIMPDRVKGKIDDAITLFKDSKDREAFEAAEDAAQDLNGVITVFFRKAPEGHFTPRIDGLKAKGLDKDLTDRLNAGLRRLEEAVRAEQGDDFSARLEVYSTLKAALEDAPAEQQAREIKRNTARIVERALALVELTRGIEGFRLPHNLAEDASSLSDQRTNQTDLAVVELAQDMEKGIHNILHVFLRRAADQHFEPQLHELEAERFEQDLLNRLRTGIAELRSAVEQERGPCYDKRITAYNTLKTLFLSVIDEQEEHDRAREEAETAALNARKAQDRAEAEAKATAEAAHQREIAERQRQEAQRRRSQRAADLAADFDLN